MKLEIKNLNVCEFASEETLCFQCTLYMDGQSRMIVSNRGHGGCDEYRPSKKSISNDELNQDLKKLETYCKSLPKIPAKLNGQDLELDVCLESLVQDLIEDYEIKRLLKKKLKKKICLVLDNDLYVIEDNPTARLIQNTRDIYEPVGYTVLNSLPFNEAFPIYKRTFS